MSGESKTDGIMVEEVAEMLQKGIEVKDRRYLLKTYPKCFVGSEAVKWLIDNNIVENVDDALNLGNILIAKGTFNHVTGDHDFKNEAYFYRFSSDETKRVGEGKKAETADGSKLSWGDFLPSLGSSETPSMTGSLPVTLQDGEEVVYRDVEVSPLDKHNIKLLDNVHPAKWVDPIPEGRYNMVVIGGGAGGLITAISCAGAGAKVALIEAHLLGGDCLNVGCVPSKALIRAAKRVHDIKTASEFGVEVEGFKVDFGKIMERMRRLRASISPHDSAERYQKLGVDVFQGRGRFTSANTIEVNGQTLEFSRACVATGGRAFVPPIPGLKDVPYLTNASVFNLTELPPRVGIIGAGPIGLELAQCFQRFGSEVTVWLRGDRILNKEDDDAAEIVYKQLVADGIKFVKNCKYTKISGGEMGASGYKGRSAIRVTVEQDGKEQDFDVDEILVAAGRKANVEDVGLEAAGIEYDRLIKVNDYLQTTNKNVYAVGDCCTFYQFTHVADFMARMVVRNALFFGSGKMSGLLIPWATYTEPEVAHVGLYEKDMKERGIAYDTYMREMADVDRAILDGETDGFVKVHCRKGTDEIIGATIVAGNAGSMISELTLAQQHGVGFGKIATTIHPYPTQAEAIAQCANMYNKTRLTPTVKALLRNVVAARR